MALRFCANLSFLFCENASASYLDKFRLASAAGFRGVEFPFPETLSVESLVSEQQNNELDIVLINISLGNLLSFFHIVQCMYKLYIHIVKRIQIEPIECHASVLDSVDSMEKTYISFCAARCTS